MEHSAGTTNLHSKGLTYANVCDLVETWYQKSKGVGEWPHSPHAKDSKALPSSFTQAKVHALVQCFEKGQSTSHPQDKSGDTYNLCSEKGHWVNNCLTKACFMTKPCSDTTKPNGYPSGPSQCLLHGNSQDMRRTADKQTRLEIQSSNWHRVHQDRKWTYLPLVL